MQQNINRLFSGQILITQIFKEIYACVLFSSDYERSNTEYWQCYSLLQTYMV